MPAGRHVDKDTFLNAFVCKTRGWFARNLKHAAPPSEGGLLRIEEGMEIGRRAWLLYPGGVWSPVKGPSRPLSRLPV